jgi:retron-type reverse transcriptase
MARFDERLEHNLHNLREALRSETFVACPIRRVNIPKPDGRLRPLGIPTLCVGSRLTPISRLSPLPTLTWN